ncbi:MAG: type II toxin-antitoxin system YafQ family toxin [Minisyncoccia bacterium]
MYLLITTKSFEKSYKKIKKSGIKQSVLQDLRFIVALLSEGKSLPILHKDHKLQGESSGLRECHIKGDLLLVYKIEKDKLVLMLVDIGSHSELF